MNFRILILIGLLIASATVMPNVLARFTGQHVFIGPDMILQQNCSKCHATVADEFKQTDAHKTIGCKDCHITAPKNKGKQFHAAALIECLICHSDPTGTGYTNAPKVTASDIFGADEAHKPLFEKANNTWGVLKGANEACIACHTHAGKVVVTEYSNFTINANLTCDTTQCSWNISLTLQK